jgi:hypothetical protein
MTAPIAALSSAATGAALATVLIFSAVAVLSPEAEQSDAPLIVYGDES